MMIITDTASDIMESEAEEMNIKLAVLDILFGDVHVGRNIPENTTKFYELLLEGDMFPQTSQPSPESYLEFIEEAQENNEEVLILTLSSTISGTYDTACMTAKLSGYPHVAVVDTKQAITAQRVVVKYAVQLRDEGKTLDEMVPLIEKFRDRVHVCGFIDTLTYLRKGGRIPAPLATIGNLLKIKPTMAIDDGNLVSPHKTKSIHAAKKIIWQELQEAHLDPEWPIYGLYADEPSIAQQWAHETEELLHIDHIPVVQSMGVIAAHLGPRCAGFCYVVAEE